MATTNLLRLLPIAAMLALATAPAHAEGRTWSEGPIPVVETNDGTGCAFVTGDAQRRAFGLFADYNGPITIFFGAFDNHKQWTGGGTITVAVDDRQFTMPVRVVKDGATLAYEINQEGLGLEFLHALYNGSTLTVNAGPAYQTSFSLTGSATAITVLHRCVDAHKTNAAPASPMIVTQTDPTTGLSNRTAIPAPSPVATPAAAVIEAALTTQNSTRRVAGALNGIPVSMILDSGCGDISIPLALAKRMAADGTLTKADFIGFGTYVLADGRKVESPQYYLRSVTIGGYTMTKVQASVSDDNSAILLGQSFLERLSSWSIDNNRHVLVMHR